MVPSPPGEQEFVAHVFAPLDGPAADPARRQLDELWQACRTDLGMTQPIVGAGLTGELPTDPRAAPEGALAGLQDPAVNFQALVRREHDILNLSLVMAAPQAPPERRRGVAAATPPGWWEYARWWRKITAGGLGALLGEATVFQAKSVDGPRTDVAAALPAQDDDATDWQTRGTTVGGFPFWEVTPGGDRAVRRFVVLADPEQDAELSGFTWSAGGVALPPLGRYLMHAAKLRYQSRVRGDGGGLARVRQRAGAGLDRLVTLLGDPAAAAEVAGARATVTAETASLLGALQALQTMRQTVEIARDNMAAALPDLLPSDVRLAEVVARRLDDDRFLLEQVRDRATETLKIVSVPVPPPDPSAVTGTAVPPEPVRARDGRVEQRLGFGVDVVEYSSRSTPQQFDVQRRLAMIVRRVLTDVGVRVHDTDRQDAGDGMMVVLPPGLELHRLLPALLHGWRFRLVADNAAHPGDRIRLRLSVGAGPFAHSAIGFTGATIIEIGRLLDSPVLRRAVVDHPDADLVALVSDRLHADVVGEGWPGLDPAHFQPYEVRVKTYRKQAWLWTGAAVTPTPDRGEAAGTATPARDVFVIHGGAEPARAAMFDFLRALGLRPLEWEELIARTGSAAPDEAEVITRAFAANAAAVVLLTPADAAAPAVLVTAGMALARQPDRTVIVEVGDVLAFAGLTGRATVRIDGANATGLHQVAQRLRTAGCAVHTDGVEWLDLDRFKNL
ncbi:CATRA conflict system CASPASE/TPR repeat-associated protein [Actinoplanes auranticolor]|uniref:Uncharacterized protein n=1 Tax=Actinoplanes auranticolor TaxID=47988 RepID=A0A919VKR0_9ACTN|nr:CATRA conflict system CASPASE/TPR repeat-associated protein [Actinoplanes auranticolor]GIM66960.1 hypothetical protein Aau02nite_25300 [Actinoplanes auranticolor]